VTHKVDLDVLAFVAQKVFLDFFCELCAKVPDGAVGAVFVRIGADYLEVARYAEKLVFDHPHVGCFTQEAVDEEEDL